MSMDINKIIAYVRWTLVLKLGDGHVSMSIDFVKKQAGHVHPKQHGHGKIQHGHSKKQHGHCRRNHMDKHTGDSFI